MNNQNKTTKTKNILTAAAAGLALCLGLGTIAAASGSASVVDTGFCVSSTGFQGEFKGERSYNCGGETEPAPVILTCSPSSNMLKQFTGVTIRWSSTRADQQTLALSTGPSKGFVDTSKLKPLSQDGKIYTYEVKLTKAQTEAILGNLLGSGFRIDVASGKAPATSRTLSMGAMGLNPTCG